MIEELEKKRPNVNYREEKVPPYTLPDPLLCRDGTRITTREQWEAKGKPETLELFRTYVYGRSPVPGQVGFEVTDTDPKAMDGKATLKRIKITTTIDGKSFS